MTRVCELFTAPLDIGYDTQTRLKASMHCSAWLLISRSQWKTALRWQHWV